MLLKWRNTIANQSIFFTSWNVFICHSNIACWLCWLTATELHQGIPVNLSSECDEFIFFAKLMHIPCKFLLWSYIWKPWIARTRGHGLPFAQLSPQWKAGKLVLFLSLVKTCVCTPWACKTSKTLGLVINFLSFYSVILKLGTKKELVIL